ncbi:hypothetical protein D7147_02135 [Micromonospora musae]|uniref:HEAT repeat domain-containing protein n=1 Tax=Micromonospora musae TaxID=1894970 RepID=A0ABX9RIX3_9ACTN|nr:hypothetical protein [Micromonospora musae]RKN23854.1 hypothetical protein D7147_02135 [Micromonospora musae]
MCVVDAAAKEAAVAGFLQEYPQTLQIDSEHPALRGCAEVPWSDIPGCPAGIPSLFYGLLDQAAAPEAAHVLTNVLMDGIFYVSAAMPMALPFLLRLVSDPDVSVRSSLLDIVVIAAELSEPVDAENERAVLLLGCDSDHPEREQCRAAFTNHASLLRMLLDDDALPHGLMSVDDRACLQKMAEAGG